MFAKRRTVQVAGGVLVALGSVGVLLWALAGDRAVWGLFGAVSCMLIGAMWLYRPENLVQTKKQ